LSFKLSATDVLSQVRR